MNKKILKTVKVIMWGLVYTLPLWQLLIATRVDVTQTLYNIMMQYVRSDNFVAQMIFKVLGPTGYVIMFQPLSGIVHYLAYFIYVNFAHICIDIVLFLPDTARYIFDKMVGSKDEDSL